MNKFWSLWGIGSINFKEWIIIWTLTLTLPTNVLSWKNLFMPRIKHLPRKKLLLC